MTMASQHPASGLYFGEVTHRRFSPKKHMLQYRIFSLFIDLDRMEELGKMSWLLSINKFNFISFYEKDHGDRFHGRSNGLKKFIIGEITSRFPFLEIKHVFLLAMPRVLGYVFNPLSIYFCYDDNRLLKAVLYEVTNTFGQRHNYIFETSASNDGKYFHECSKMFYVSPFLGMDLDYKFNITVPDKSFSLAIQSCRGSEIVMNAAQVMTFAELSNKNLVLALVSFPLMTIKVIAGIHFEALKLWLKGVKLVPNTSPVDKSTRALRDNRR